MILELYWKDIEGKSYRLGELYKKNIEYNFDTDEEGLKKAISKGCFGIGDINLLYRKNTSNVLFKFFKKRIPSKDSDNIKEILKTMGIGEYDEMEILKRTKGIIATDRYYLEERK